MIDTPSKVGQVALLDEIGIWIKDLWRHFESIDSLDISTDRDCSLSVLSEGKKVHFEFANDVWWLDVGANAEVISAEQRKSRLVRFGIEPSNGGCQLIHIQSRWMSFIRDVRPVAMDERSWFAWSSSGMPLEADKRFLAPN